VQKPQKGDELMRVTIVLTTGAFFPTDDKNPNHIDVGYCETPHASDIDVFEDGNPARPPHIKKLGKGNIKIAVEHLEKDGVTVKQPVKLSQSFNRDILKKDDLYIAAEIPAFNEKEYDCIVRFHSGEFTSADVRPRRFTEHRLSDDRPTGNDKTTKAIANEIHVAYDVADGEVLRLRAPGHNVWSTASVKSGTASVVVKMLTDDTLNPRYHKRALLHKGQHYYLPNSDPPPMDGP
jgi:hypothetical protein